MAHDVFISYAIEDKATAYAVCQWLEAGGYSCWIAPRDIRPGQRFAEAITQAIDGTRVTVFVFSGNSNHSVYVHNEIAISFEKNVPIIPFRIEDVLPSENLRFYLGAVQWLDALTLPVEQHFDKLIEALDQFIPRPKPSTHAHGVEMPGPQVGASRSTIEVRSRDKYRHIGQSDSGGSDSPRFPGLPKIASTIQRLWKSHPWKIAAVTAAILCSIGTFYAAYFHPFTARQISNIGVSFRDGASADSAMRALKLYQEKFPRMHSKFSNREIQLITGDQNELPYKEVLGVIGKLTSDWALCEVKEYDDLKLLYISPGATNPDVTSGKKYVFSMNFNDTMQGRMIANFLRHVRKCESVAVVYDEKAYSKGLQSGFLHSLFTSYHAVPMDTSKNFPTDFVRELLKPLWQNDKPVDAIVILLESQEGATLTKELLEQRFKNLIVCPESCFKQAFIEKIGEDHTNLYVATPLVEGFGTKKDLEFRNEFLRDGGKEVPLWSIFAYEATDLLMQTYLANPKPQNNRQESDRIRKSFENMRSVDSAKISLSGPLLFEQSGFIRRPVIITRIDGGRFRPVSMQIQEHFGTTGGSDKEIIANMTERGQAVPTDKSSDGGTGCLIKIPVVYTRVQVNELSEFDAGQESVKINYEISTKWPKDYDEKSEWAGAVNIVSPKVMKISEDVQVSQKGKTDPALSHQVKRSDPKKCWNGEAMVPWEPDLTRFPLDSRALKLLVGFSGEDPLEVILAVDGEASKNEAVPKVADQFEAVKCPTCSDRTYLNVQETSFLTNPWTREALTHKYLSVYELQFVLRRKPLYSALVLLPLAMVALGSAVFIRPGRHARVKTIMAGLAIVGLLALYAESIVPFKPPVLCLINGCFLVSALMVVACLLYAALTTHWGSHTTDLAQGEPPDKVRSEGTDYEPTYRRSWTGLIVQWLPRTVLALASTYVVVVAVFWIQWMRASTLCQ